MPNYYGESMQAHWAMSKGVWVVRYLKHKTKFAEYTNLLMKDVVFRTYIYNERNSHPVALIEGKLVFDKVASVSGWTPVTEEQGPDKPVFVIGVDEPITTEDKFNWVSLGPNKQIDAAGRQPRPHTTHDNTCLVHKHAIAWNCEIYKNGTKVREERVTALHQWNAVKYLLKLKTVRRMYGEVENNVLTWDDNMGNLIIVRPIENF